MQGGTVIQYDSILEGEEYPGEDMRTMAYTQQKGNSLQAKGRWLRRNQGEDSLCGSFAPNLILDFKPLKLRESNFCCSSYSACGGLFWQLDLTDILCSFPWSFEAGVPLMLVTVLYWIEEPPKRGILGDV